MLSILDRETRLCDGLTRREWMRVGSLGAFGFTLPALNADQYLEVRFEDLVSRPKDVLLTISEFFELDPDADKWIDRGAALVRGVPPTRFDTLAPEEQAPLSEACRVGMQLLGRAS